MSDIIEGQLSLIDIGEAKTKAPEPVVYPSWYTPSKERHTANQRVMQGRHPMGMELAQGENTCGGCAHLVRKAMSKTYIKCSKVKMTGGPATDVRVMWPACVEWGPKS